MSSARLQTVRLKAFKSHQDQEFTLAPLTLLVGPNASGKSNALDALSLLALLADERAVGDLERGDQEVAGLRGGISGAVPFGRNHVAVGCTVSLGKEGHLALDLEIEAAQSSETKGREPEIVREQLVWHRPNRKRLDLIDSRRRAPGSGIADVQVYSGGAPRNYQFLSSKLATAQAISKVPEDTKSRRQVVERSKQVLQVLGGILVLDPVPAQMREYVRIGSSPDRNGANLSALIYRLREDERSWDRLEVLVNQLVEGRVESIDFAEARLPDQRLVDVMVALREDYHGVANTVPARLMSDGTLRYLAIVASLLELQALADADGGARTLVVEEIENGLYPSQASNVLALLRDESQSGGTQLLATTHSPALLDSLIPEDHEGVIVCQRDSAGDSHMSRLVDMDNYVRIAGAGRIGRAATEGQLTFNNMGPKTPVSELIS